MFPFKKKYELLPTIQKFQEKIEGHQGHSDRFEKVLWDNLQKEKAQMLYVKKEVNAKLCNERKRIANGVWELILEIHEQVWTCPGSHGWLCHEKTFHSQ